MKGASKDTSFAFPASDPLNISYLEIPLKAAFPFGLSDRFSLAVNGGFYGAVRLNGKESQPDPKRMDFGVDAGLNFIIKSLVICPGAQYGLTNVFKDGSANYHNTTYSLMLCYRF